MVGIVRYVRKKKKKVRSYKNRKLLQVILMESGMEGRKEGQEHVKKIPEQVQPGATCGTHKLHTCIFLRGISGQIACTIREKTQERSQEPSLYMDQC